MTIADGSEVTPTSGGTVSTPDVAATDGTAKKGGEGHPCHDPETGESASTGATDDAATTTDDDDGRKSVPNNNDERIGEHTSASPRRRSFRGGNRPIHLSQTRQWKSAPSSLRSRKSSIRRLRRKRRHISELCEATEWDLYDDWDDVEPDDDEWGGPKSGHSSPRCHPTTDTPDPIIIDDEDGVGIRNKADDDDDDDDAARAATAAAAAKAARVALFEHLEYESMGMIDARRFGSDHSGVTNNDKYDSHGLSGHSTNGGGSGKNNMDGTTRDETHEGKRRQLRKVRPSPSTSTRSRTILMEPSTVSSTMLYAAGRSTLSMRAAWINPIATIRRRRNSVVALFGTDPFEFTYNPSEFRFYQPPLQRQRWGQTQVQPRINWGDLFFDLFYVGAAYKTANILVYTPSATGVLYFLGTFFSIMQIWMNKTFYDARFVNSGEDLYHRIWEVVHLTALASAILHIQTAPSMSHTFHYQDMFAFAISLAIVHFLYIIRFVELYFVGRGQRDVLQQEALREGGNLCVGLALLVVAAVLAGIDFFGPNGAGGGGSSSSSTGEYDGSASGSHRWLVLTLTAATGTESYSNATTNNTTTTTYGNADIYDASGINTAPIWFCLMLPIVYWLSFACHSVFFFPRDGYSHKKFIVPLNVSFSIRRDGDWTMLMYGESILSLLSLDIPQETSEYYLTFYFSLSTVILLTYLHFSSQPHDPDDHVFRRSKDRSLIWKLFLFLYASSLISLGASFTLFVKSFFYPSSSMSAESEASDGYQTTSTRDLTGTSAELPYPADELVHRAAYLFSASLTLVYLSMDVMSLMHVGLKHAQRRIYCTESKIINRVGIVLILSRIALLSFCATLGVWCYTNVEVLSGIGLAATIVQLALRRLGETYLPEEVEYLDGTEVAMG